MKSIVYAALVASVSAAGELQAYVSCKTLATAEGQTDYDAAAEVTACGANITADSCATAALAVDTSASAGKMACVAHESACNADEPTHTTCVYYEQAAEAGAQPDTWDPRECTEVEADSAGVVTWGDTPAWEADIADCPPAEEEAEEETDEEASSNGLSAGVATLAIALALQMWKPILTFLTHSIWHTNSLSIFLSSLLVNSKLKLFIYFVIFPSYVILKPFLIAVSS